MDRTSMPLVDISGRIGIGDESPYKLDKSIEGPSMDSSLKVASDVLG